MQLLENNCCPGQVAQLVGALFCAPKGCRLISWSGHIPRLQVQSLVRAYTRGNQSMFLSLSLPLSQINLKKNPQVGIKEKENNFCLRSLKLHFRLSIFTDKIVAILFKETCKTKNSILLKSVF